MHKGYVSKAPLGFFFCEIAVCLVLFFKAEDPILLSSDTKSQHPHITGTQHEFKPKL